jgi:hypothetical protein
MLKRPLTSKNDYGALFRYPRRCRACKQGFFEAGILACLKGDFAPSAFHIRCIRQVIENGVELRAPGEGYLLCIVTKDIVPPCITCLKCGYTSFHFKDVQNLFCQKCQYFHEFPELLSVRN